MIGANSRPIRTPTLLLRLLLFTALSVALMLADHQANHLHQIRSALTVLTYPLVTIAAIPARVGGWMSDAFSSEEKLRTRYMSLQEQHEILQAKLQQFEALEAENRRLRSLLGSATRVADRAAVAELVEVSTEPFTRTIVISKGSDDHVYLGQPVLDAYGIVGQITEVAPHISRVTLITDPGHAIPVQVVRNGLRTVLYGTGDNDSVDLPFLTSSANIKVGDLLISSGMGGRFPPRYPVAKVIEIVNDPNEAFLQIRAKPMAKLQHHKEVLLVWPGKNEQLRAEPQ